MKRRARGTTGAFRARPIAGYDIPKPTAAAAASRPKANVPKPSTTIARNGNAHMRILSFDFDELAYQRSVVTLKYKIENTAATVNHANAIVYFRCSKK